MSMIKNVLKTAAVALLGFTAITSANAGSLKAKQAMSIDVGGASGIAYYIPEGDAYRVVVTIAAEAGPPMRFEAELASGQSVSFSTPSSSGATGKTIALSRHGEEVVISSEGTALGL